MVFSSGGAGHLKPRAKGETTGMVGKGVQTGCGVRHCIWHPAGCRSSGLDAQHQHRDVNVRDATVLQVPDKLLEIGNTG